MINTLKQRVTGAIFLVALGVIFIPALLNGMPTDGLVLQSNIPDLPPLRDSLRSPRQLANMHIEQGYYDKKQSEGLLQPLAWSVQVGQFNEQKFASNLTQQLRQQGFAAYIRQQVGSVTYTVYVGPFAQKDHANQLSSKLESIVGWKGSVVSFLPQPDGNVKAEQLG